MSDAYRDLMAFERETQALAAIAGRLEWDQETMMPRGAAPQRGEEVAAEVIDGPQSRVFDQAENRLHVQKALVAMLMG